MIRTEKTHLKTVARSHAGMSGKNNEDRFGVTAFHLDEQTGTPVLFAVLADGIGGHRAGEVAAEMVVDIVSKIVAESDGSDPQGTLQQAIQTASNEVYRRAQAEEGRKGMGATVVCAWVIGKRLYTAYVGDSRIYLLRDGQILQLSRDHSWIQEALDTGLLTPEQAVGHPNAHVIRRFVGSPEPSVVDFRMYLDPTQSEAEAIGNQGLLLKNTDRLLLCSDGLTDLVEDEEILEVIEKHTPENAVDRLIDMANQRGGHDNITTILVRVPEGVFVEKAAVPARASLPMRSLALGCLGLAMVAALAAAGYLGVRWWNNREQQPATQTPELAFTDQPVVLDTQPETVVSIPAVVGTPLPTFTSEPDESPQAPSADTGSSNESNIPPPPSAGEVSPFPTNTPAPTHTRTPTQTRTGTTTSTLPPGTTGTP